MSRFEELLRELEDAVAAAADDQVHSRDVPRLERELVAARAALLEYHLGLGKAAFIEGYSAGHSEAVTTGDYNPELASLSSLAAAGEKP